MENYLTTWTTLSLSSRTLLHVLSRISTLSLNLGICSYYLTKLVNNFLANRYPVSRHKCGCYCHVAISCGRCKWKRYSSDKEKWVHYISRSDSKLAPRTSLQCAWYIETSYMVSVAANSGCEYHHCCLWAAWAGALRTLWQAGKCHILFLCMKWKWLKEKKTEVASHTEFSQRCLSIYCSVSCFIVWWRTSRYLQLILYNSEI